jgi:hypothetical protein
MGQHSRDEAEQARREIARVFGVDDADLEPTAEEVEARRQYNAVRASMADRCGKVAEQVTARSHQDGWLPRNWQLVYAPVPDVPTVQHPQPITISVTRR